MPKNQAIASQTDFAPVFENGDLPKRRKSENLPGGLYYFEDELETSGFLTANVITCAGWLLELLKLDAGEISFFCGEEEIRPRFTQLAIFYPPFTITRPCFRNVRAILKGIAGIAAFSGEFPKKPLVLETDFAKSLKNAAHAAEVLRSSRDARIVEAHPKASLLSIKAKRLIDENYHVYPSIARIATRLKVSHEHLTRQFKRDFCITPSAYLHQLRISDASFRLLRGEAIIEVSGEVGYNDLSRFYKQFRKTTSQSPGFCKALK